MANNAILMAHAVAEAAGSRRRFSARELLPVLYGCSGLVDVTTIERVVDLESGI